ncbi:hypothetical protein LTR85_002934 [Meristemomyces frigidus]|nr:hypothetical protein LTR85_002934 [Meristemomyces frigidus]
MSPDCFSSHPPRVPCKSLSPEEAEHFLTHGWLKVSNAIKPEYIDAWMADFWVRTGYDEHDKTTWKDEYLHLPHHRQVRHDELCPEAWNKISDVCGGEERIHLERERWIGDNFIVNFGSEARSQSLIDSSPKEKAGWHCDNDWYRQFLDSTGTAMTIVHCFTDIPARGGGTWLCEDGIARVVQQLYDHPEGFDPGLNTGDICDGIMGCEEFVPVVAKKGDVFIMHGLLPHVAGFNYLHYARVITNPHVTLRDPYDLNRPDGEYSLLEQVILRGLERSSVPEYKPPRERMYWYPRNWTFKEAKIRAELDAMIAVAKAKGLDETAVDSVWLQGEQAREDFDRRNGMLLPVHEATGFQPVQHKL